MDDDDLLEYPFKPYTPLDYLASKELKSFSRLVNININVYNINIKRFIKFVRNLEEEIITIERNIKQIFICVTNLIQQISIESNYDMELRIFIRKALDEYCTHYINLWEKELLSLWQYSERVERILRQNAWLLKKTRWILRNGFLNLKLDDYDYYSPNQNEISTHLIKQRGISDIGALVLKERNKIFLL